MEVYFIKYDSTTADGLEDLGFFTLKAAQNHLKEYGFKIVGMPPVFLYANGYGETAQIIKKKV